MQSKKRKSKVGKLKLSKNLLFRLKRIKIIIQMLLMITDQQKE